MAITRDQVAETAHLGRLAMDDAELDKFTGQLQNILEYASMLNELDIEGVEPMSHAVPIRNIFREDKSRPGLPVTDVLEGAPDAVGDFFSVPKIIDEGEGH